MGNNLMLFGLLDNIVFFLIKFFMFIESSRVLYDEFQGSQDFFVFQVGVLILLIFFTVLSKLFYFSDFLSLKNLDFFFGF